MLVGLGRGGGVGVEGTGMTVGHAKQKFWVPISASEITFRELFIPGC